MYDDTTAFVEEIYLKSDGVNYTEEYYDENFVQRTADIYLPKIDYLNSVLNSGNNGYVKILMWDVVAAILFWLVLSKFSVRGIDVGKNQVEFGNNQIKVLKGEAPLFHVEESAFLKKL